MRRLVTLRPPAPGRYSRMKDLRPDRIIRTPKPLTSGSKAMKGLARGSSASIACFVSLELSKIATVVATEKETSGPTINRWRTQFQVVMTRQERKRNREKGAWPDVCSGPHGVDRHGEIDRRRDVSRRGNRGPRCRRRGPRALSWGSRAGN